jgi:hypothetical protein
LNEERKIKTEEVEAVSPPPRARVPESPGVADTFTRKRDYLSGFLAGEPAEEPKGGPGSDLQAAVVDLVWEPPWDPSKMSDEARLELGML